MGFSYQHNDSSAKKVALRRVILATRRTLSPTVRRDADEAIAVAALSAARRCAGRLGHAATVAAYCALPDEPGAGLVDRLFEAGHRVLLPVLLPDNDLDWGVHTGSMVAGRGRPAEPPGPHLGPEAVAEADVVLVPALAVDADGARLGRGGGSYDRALARVPAERPVLALLYDGEWPHEVPRESHDRAMTGVITPYAGLVVISR